MFFLFLALNAFTDLREGSVYDGFSILLLVAAAAETGFAFKDPYFIGCLAVLGGIFLLDRTEQWLGRGDYLILLAVSLHSGSRLPLVLLVTSGAGLLYLALKKIRTIPLVPFLLLGSVLAALPAIR